jgi:putative ABC transport system substrate-binding protein
MKKQFLAGMMSAALALSMAGCSGSSSTGTDSTAGGADNTSAAATYKVGIIQWVDDASLNQIEKAIETELAAKSAELNVNFEFTGHVYNGQADSTTVNQMAAQMIADEVDLIIPIATPTACVIQAATEDNQIPVVFSAVTDPVSAGLVSSLDAPGSNITGTSDALDTEAVFNLITAANPEIKKIGLLYNKSEDSSTKAIEEAKAYCEGKGITVVEKTGTTNEEVMLAADALIAEGVEAVFTPTDNTVMTAELGIYEKFIDAKIPHYAGADSFALNGAFCGYGVNYEELGTATADMAVDILVNGKKPGEMAVQTLDNGIATVNTETADAIGLDYSMFADMCEALVETKTAQDFE